MPTRKTRATLRLLQTTLESLPTCREVFPTNTYWNGDPRALEGSAPEPELFVSARNFQGTLSNRNHNLASPADTLKALREMVATIKLWQADPAAWRRAMGWV